MRTLKLTHLSIFGFLTLSGCLQPGPTPQELTQKSSEPLVLSKSDPNLTSSRQSTGEYILSQIEEGTAALFQVLETDPSDLNTIHERASRLAGFERDFEKHFLSDCTEAELKGDKTSLKIEKLTAIARETDAAVIQLLAIETWNLFHAESGNPFIKTKAPAKSAVELSARSSKEKEI